MNKLEEILINIIKETGEELDEEFYTNIENTMPISLRAMKEAYQLGRNDTADWIKENAKIKRTDLMRDAKWYIDKESIEEAKTTKDLDI